ncbi:uncharacterized protein LOC123505216 isoform X2 [Portunus trituberculatus]|uniref:uncharacterized protein LOC123505216 isoform X2 n=1 Tax=Portunus trituberculatus TaxID=210409 RepID=UPI001E1D1273|nr:uncharacterized protein LOC123505216 isoform X2 [Portunus trituberculatus]
MSKGMTQQPYQPQSTAARNMGSGMQNALNTGTEDKADAAKQKPRRQPCCGSCRNHNLEVPVINHQCQYAECTCVFCELTRRRRRIMRHQQRLWRFKKFSWQQREMEENTSEGEGTPNNCQSEEQQEQNHARREMVCDKCRNHNKIVKKRGHKGSCPFENCKCELCVFTLKRQKLMKHQQRVRRSQIAAPMVRVMRTQPQPQATADSPDSDLQSVESVPTTPPTDSLHERMDRYTEAERSPLVHAVPQEMSPTVEWTSQMSECTMEEAPQPQGHCFQPVTTTPGQPASFDPQLEYHSISDIHSTVPLTKNDHNFNSSQKLECPEHMRFSVMCGGFGRVAQVQNVSTTLSSLPTYGHHHFVPWNGPVSEVGDRCRMEANNNVHHKVPFRPQPIPADRFPRPQMDWPFIGFPYPSANVIQSAPQPSISVCDNFMPHHPQTAMDEHWYGTRGPVHPTEGNGVSPYSGGIPYFASALLHPGAKPSLSFMPTNRTLPEYGSSLSEYKERDPHNVNHFRPLPRNCNNITV